MNSELHQVSPKTETCANLFGLEREELEQAALDCGQPRYRGRQLYRGVYRNRNFDLAAFTDLSKPFREALRSKYRLALPDVREKHQSGDGAVRYLLLFEDGQEAESVYMPEENRVTLCLSSQAGCAVGCRFCFTALMGLKRNLTAAEILGQVYVLVTDQAISPNARLNLVFMGMGEPLLNLQPVMKAVRILADPAGLNVPLRRITISTAGIIPGIRALSREPLRPKLAVSLNASTDEQRTALMPLNRKYPLAELMAACRDFPLRPRERLTFEYVLLDGINDSKEDALRVAQLIRGLRAKVNLIPYNPGPDLPYKSSPWARVTAFQETLTRQSLPAFIRLSRGRDVRAACGQLALGGPLEDRVRQPDFL
jgi:23S rRNA (adenine2503-C2)-methyltransferase